MKNFNLFLENTYKRMATMGFSPGDVVKVKANAASHEYVKAGSDMFAKAITQLIDDKVQLVIKEFDTTQEKPVSVHGIFALVRPLIGPNWVGNTEFILPTDVLELCYESHTVTQMHEVPKKD